jgi:hypothetical protein
MNLPVSKEEGKGQQVSQHVDESKQVIILLLQVSVKCCTKISIHALTEYSQQP